jgi:hypothetical protein
VDGQIVVKFELDGAQPGSFKVQSAVSGAVDPGAVAVSTISVKTADTSTGDTDPTDDDDNVTDDPITPVGDGDSEENGNAPDPVIQSDSKAFMDPARFRFDLNTDSAKLKPMEALSTDRPFQHNLSMAAMPRERIFKHSVEESEGASVKAYERLREALNAIEKQTGGDIELDEAIAGTAAALTTGLSAGYVVWLLRGGMLLSSLLSQMPAWHLADPLPILTRMKDESNDDESLESIIKEGSKNDDEHEQDDSDNGMKTES